MLQSMGLQSRAQPEQLNHDRRYGCSDLALPFPVGVPAPGTPVVQPGGNVVVNVLLKFMDHEVHGWACTEMDFRLP